MPSFLATFRCIRYSLSLIILIANTAAPLYSRNGRSVLDPGGPGTISQSVARVRVVSHVNSVQGFRAPVGLAKGGHEAYLDVNLPVILPTLSASIQAGSSQAVSPTTARPHAPLRC
jgi:hypothetical protein